MAGGVRWGTDSEEHRARQERRYQQRFRGRNREYHDRTYTEQHQWPEEPQAETGRHAGAGSAWGAATAAVTGGGPPSASASAIAGQEVMVEYVIMTCTSNASGVAPAKALPRT